MKTMPINTATMTVRIGLSAPAPLAGAANIRGPRPSCQRCDPLGIGDAAGTGLVGAKIQQPGSELFGRSFWNHFRCLGAAKPRSARRCLAPLSRARAWVT
jgi:hypothetical protein